MPRTGRGWRPRCSSNCDAAELQILEKFGIDLDIPAKPAKASPNMSGDAYSKAGVDQGAADSAVAGLVRALGAIELGRPSRQVPLPGHYASVIKLDQRTGIALSTDGVGTKLLVAEQLGRFDTVGIDRSEERRVGK